MCLAICKVACFHCFFIPQARTYILRDSKVSFLVNTRYLNGTLLSGLLCEQPACTAEVNCCCWYMARLCSKLPPMRSRYHPQDGSETDAAGSETNGFLWIHGGHGMWKVYRCSLCESEEKKDFLGSSFSFSGLRFFLSEVALKIGRSEFLSQNHRTLCCMFLLKCSSLLFF